MKERPLRTTVVGSYPFPGWLEFVSEHLDEFGKDDLAEALDDAVTAAVHDQIAAGLDVISDGEQTRLDFNLSFYGFLEGIDGIDFERRVRMGIRNNRYEALVPTVTGALRRRHAVHAGEARIPQQFLQRRRLLRLAGRSGVGIAAQRLAESGASLQQFPFGGGAPHQGVGLQRCRTGQAEDGHHDDEG